jgi:hypothetical protein
VQPLSGAFRKWPASRQRVQQRQGLALQAMQCIPTMSQRRMKRESNARIAKISALNRQNYLLPLGLLPTGQPGRCSITAHPLVEFLHVIMALWRAMGRLVAPEFLLKNGGAR